MLAIHDNIIDLDTHKKVYNWGQSVSWYTKPLLTEQGKYQTKFRDEGEATKFARTDREFDFPIQEYNPSLMGNEVAGDPGGLRKNKKEVVMSVGIDPGLLIYCIPKGSIAFDGISLTIARINDNIIEVALIPHTIEYTNLSKKEIGDSINIETDIIGKYIYRFISENENYEDINSILIKTLNNLGLS